MNVWKNVKIFLFFFLRKTESCPQGFWKKKFPSLATWAATVMCGEGLSSAGRSCASVAEGLCAAAAAAAPAAPAPATAAASRAGKCRKMARRKQMRQQQTVYNR